MSLTITFREKTSRSVKWTLVSLLSFNIDYFLMFFSRQYNLSSTANLIYCLTFTYKFILQIIYKPQTASIWPSVQVPWTKS